MTYKYILDEDGIPTNCQANLIKMNWIQYYKYYHKIDYEDFLVIPFKQLVKSVLTLVSFLVIFFTYPISAPLIAIFNLRAIKKEIRKKNNER